MRMARLTAVAGVVLTMTACGDAPAPMTQRDLGRIEAVGPAGVELADAPAAPAEVPDGVRTLEWADLVPKDFRPDELIARYDAEHDLSSLGDDDPRAQELMRKLMDLWNEAPTVEELDGQTVRLPGFVVPLEGDGRKVNEFLLVPYYGACIHVPPPPANQTVHVRTQDSGARVRGLFDTVWVTGVVHVERKKSTLAEAGYQIEAIEVAPYN